MTTPVPRLKVHGTPSFSKGYKLENIDTLGSEYGLNTVQAFEDQVVIYTMIEGALAWFPLGLGQESATHAHTQVPEEAIWEVTHGMGTDQIFVTVKDSVGNLVYSLQRIESDPADPLNKCFLHFPIAISGVAFLVGARAFNTPRLNASELHLAGSVVFNSAGIQRPGKMIEYDSILNTDDLTGMITEDLAERNVVYFDPQTGLIPAFRIPGQIDEVLEYPMIEAFPATGESGKIYVAINGGTPENPSELYRWSGTQYTKLPTSPGTTDDVVEGQNNKYFAEYRVLDTLLTSLNFLVDTAIAGGDTLRAAFGKLQAQINKIWAAKDQPNGFVGLTGRNINFGNQAGTNTSELTNFNTVARTYTFPDKNITVAGLGDISAVATGVNTGDETAATIRAKLGITSISGVNTGDETGSSIVAKLGYTPVNPANIGSGVLTGFQTLSGNVQETDTIVQGIGRVQGQTSALASSVTAALAGKLDSSNGVASLLQINQGKTRQAPNLAASSGTITLDYSLGDLVKVTLSGGPITVAFSGMPADGLSIMLIEAVNFGGYVVNWPAGTRFVGGSPPTGLTVSGRDYLLLIRDGTGAYTLLSIGKDVK